ncbi:MAG: prepilin peptidase [Solirubrobacterales bacterium]|nr:prepilin peptidase [Solirubrobacterales bacterium]
MVLALVFAALLGLCVGSFLNVVIYRLPRNESLATPGSHCPGCGVAVASRDNIPVLSWMLLRGRCRQCNTAISGRYPLVEAVTAVLAVGVVLAKGADRDAWLGLAFVLVLVPCALIDLEHRIIPNKITLPGAVAAIAITALTHPGHLPEQLIAGGAAFTFLLVAALAYPSGMGMGDVKLAGVMGLFLGRSVAPALLVALLAGSLFGMGVIARKGSKEGRKTAVPFGPFLAVGGLVGLFAGPAIVHWYLHSFT